MKIQDIRAKYRRGLQRLIKKTETDTEPDLGRARVLASLYGVLLSYFADEEAGQLEARLEAIEDRLEGIEAKK